MSHKILLGLDEAGYGPNIGPLVIGASVWQVANEYDAQRLGFDLMPVLLEKLWKAGDKHVPLGDSKNLFSPNAGIRSLETGVWSLLAVHGVGALKLAEMIDQLCQPGTAERLAVHPWYESVGQPGMIEQTLPQIRELKTLAREQFERVGVKFLGVYSRIIPELEFNQQVTASGSKGQLLSVQTLSLAAALMKQFDCPIEVFCDRQGGRKKYLPLLLEIMSPEWFHIIDETPARSSYRSLSTPHKTIHFTVGGDAFPPVGLASMTAKYLRERLMLLINIFWQKHLASLRPTAGYPQDAKRFRAEIEPIADQLGFQPNSWWRIC